MEYPLSTSGETARFREWQPGTSGLAYLRRAKRRIEHPKKWGKGQDVLSGRFSIVRALELEDDGAPGFESAMKALRAVTGGNPRKWNDRFWRSHAAALKALDLAIEIELKNANRLGR